MQSWGKLAVAVAVPGAAVLFVILASICLHCRRRRRRSLIPGADAILPRSVDTVHAKDNRCFFVPDGTSSRFQYLDHRRSHRHQRHPHRPVTAFRWDDHRALVTQAVEGGWSRFAFLGRESLPRSASLLVSFVACNPGRPPAWGTEVDWEIPLGSSEFMQTVRLVAENGSYSATRMGLPLPGPPLGGDPPSFPQEAYFEITVLHLQRRQLQQQPMPSRRANRVNDSSGDGDQEKLVTPENPSSLFLSSAGIQKESKSPNGEDNSGRKDLSEATIWLGLTRGGSPAEKPPPGRQPGSIGFSSNGSLFLDGMELVRESEMVRWERPGKVVGCGFDPQRKTVFFTLDGILLHVVHCRSEAFGSPLYPALAADADAMVSINLGQCTFRYPPANAQRTPNPCFLRPSASARIRYDDSRELFSMGRIDSHWRDVISWKTRQKIGGGGGSGSGDYRDGSSAAGKTGEEDKGGDHGGPIVVDIDTESDLFEIPLSR